MATITITRDFTLQADENPDLLSVYVPSSITFQFDRGASTNTYATVVINGIAFRATKTGTVGTVDTYKFNSTDIFRYLLKLPIGDFSSIVDSLVLSITAVCNGYSSTGTLLATASHKAFKICLAVSAEPYAGLNLLETYGRTSTVYHSGAFSYFSVNDKIYKNGSGTTGTFTTDGCNFNIVTVGDTSTHYVFNKDGCFDQVGFTEISTERTPNKKTAISLYSDNLDTWQAESYEPIEAIEEKKTFRIVAYNADHYNQLYFITQSPLILDSNFQIWELSSPPAPLNPCKQNLNFTFSLKRKIYGQSY